MQANPLQAFNLLQFLQQYIQARLAVQIHAIAGNILCDYQDFLCTAGYQLFCLSNQLFHRHTTEATADKRNYTIAATVVATLCNAQIGSIIGSQQVTLAGKATAILGRKICQTGLALQCLLDSVYDIAITTGTQSCIYFGQFRQELCFVAFSQTAGNNQSLN